MTGWLVPILNLLNMGGGEPGLAPPVADFSGTPLSGTIPLAVQFTDLSTGTPTSWLWSAVGQNTSTTYTSTSQNPLITFTVADTYNVTLTATNAGGSDAELKTGYLVASPVPPPPPAPATCSWTPPAAAPGNWSDTITGGSGWDSPAPAGGTWNSPAVDC